MSYSKEILASNLAAAIRESGISKVALSRDAKVTRTTIDACLDPADKTDVRIGTLVALGKVLERDLIWLLTDHSKPQLAPEPTNADLLEEIRALREARNTLSAAEPESDPFIRQAVGLLRKIDETKRSAALEALRAFANHAAASAVQKPSVKRGKL